MIIDISSQLYTSCLYIDNNSLLSNSPQSMLIHAALYVPSLFFRALVYVCHGVGEYMGRYDELGSYLSQNGLLVFGHDHGKCNYVHMSSCGGYTSHTHA